MSIVDNEIIDNGGEIYLRPLLESDINDRYVSWFDDSDVVEFLESSNLTISDSVEYLRHGIETKSYFIYAIIHKDSDFHIGNVKVGPINWNHGVSDLVTVIGEKEYWGRGLAKQAIALGNKIAFDIYGLRKLSGGFIEGNEGSLRAYTRAGWVVEGRLKKHYLIDGTGKDRIIISCFNPGLEW